jgi:demethylmenaquinone methyltransferase/2-methoxy-6-polyprenyl-1,4-benzoquinol methylase
MSNDEQDAGAALEVEIAVHEAMFVLREPAIRAAIRELRLERGSRGLDAGCGIGLIAEALAEAVSPGGQVTGLDLSATHLAYGKDRVRRLGLQDQIRFRHGDVNHLPFEAGEFDWAWSMDTLWPGPREMGCPSEDPFSMVVELARVVRPGGTVALVFWSSQKLLPGYPLLEARLSATSQAAAPFQEEMVPDQHALRGLAWLRAAGLEKSRAETFIATATAPLSDPIRRALAFTFPMFWAGIEDEVSPEDWAEYNRLCQPSSPDFVLDDPHYHAFLTYTLFYGTVA